jgi:acetyltransferase-like isoleucine patch superfamily enzyme
MLKSRGASFLTLIHPTVVMGIGCRIGEGCVFAPYSGIGADVELGAFVTVNSFSGVGHDAIVGNGCTLSAHCDVTGGAELGEGVFLGSHACVMPRVKVGDFAVVGAGSVALRPVKAHASVMGVPARLIAGPRSGGFRRCPDAPGTSIAKSDRRDFERLQERQVNR